MQAAYLGEADARSRGISRRAPHGRDRDATPRSRRPATAMSALVEARDLHAYYGESHVLRGVSLAIAAGESIGLMGRNGMGKTTLIRTLLGLVPSRAGSVLVHGRDCTREPPHRIARLGIAYVPEGRGIFPNLAVRENLLIAARPRARRRATGPTSACSTTFPRLEGAARGTAASSCPAASSRCSRSAAR